MNPVAKALWYIENHSSKELSLAEIANASGVSRFHLTRAFGLATGLPVVQYLRARRLTEAAKALAAGAPDILTVALNAGYSSHESFTRAFREQFASTPEAVRAQSNLAGLALCEPFRLPPDTPTVDLGKPRIETVGPLLIAGLGERFNEKTSAGIPALWQRFAPYLGQIPTGIVGATYGILCNSDDETNRDYLCGVEVRNFSKLSSEFMRQRLPERRYAVFHHSRHVAVIRETWAAIWNSWAPCAPVTIADAPEFEKYTQAFDPLSGNGGVEIWIPLEGN